MIFHFATCEVNGSFGWFWFAGGEQRGRSGLTVDGTSAQVYAQPFRLTSPQHHFLLLNSSMFVLLLCWPLLFTLRVLDTFRRRHVYCALAVIPDDVFLAASPSPRRVLLGRQDDSVLCLPELRWSQLSPSRATQWGCPLITYRITSRQFNACFSQDLFLLRWCAAS